MQIPVFFLEPTDLVRVELRRFTFAAERTCVASEWGCDASVRIQEQAPREDWIEDNLERRIWRAREEAVGREDPRWPACCDRCGIAFGDESVWQVAPHPLFSGAPDGRLYTIRDAPAGAMWDAVWFEGAPAYTGPDGIALVVRTPGGEWMVDSEASNCTRKGDRSHKCWIRHGDPRDPQGLRTGRPLHVDKAGDTCSAGAGSIVCGTYHGFLHGGFLRTC